MTSSHVTSDNPASGKEPPVLSAPGWAVVRLADDAILAETVAPTRRAAIVNWLVVSANVLVSNTWGDLQIEKAFELASPGIARVVEIFVCVKHSAPPAGVAADREPAFQDGVTHAIALLGRAVGCTDWLIRDGSDDRDTDIVETIIGVLGGAGLYDEDTGRWACLASPTPGDRTRKVRL